LRKACHDDVLFYINTFVWQYNPRKVQREEKVGPFLSWDFQDKAIRKILESVEKQRDLVIEKSREMGASWMCLIAMEWLWHWHGWQKFLCISRNEAAVDDDDPDSLFWKLDFMHRYMPKWFLPGDGQGIRRRRLFFGNDANGSSITGQASTGKAGVGGRATAMFIDEFSQIDEDFEVLHRTSDTTGSRIFNFTHLGLDTAAYHISQSPDFDKLRLHWTQHPDKVHGLYQCVNNKVEIRDKTYRFPIDYPFLMDGKIRSPWYDEQCRRKGSARAVAMDLDINPRGSVSQFFEPEVILAIRDMYSSSPLWQGDLEYDRELGRPTELVESASGSLLLWLNLTIKGLPPDGFYCIGADLSTGSGATPSCLSIGNAVTGEKIGEYANAFKPIEDMAVMTVALCWLFHSKDGEGAKLCWEANGPGIQFGKRVMELGYRNVYFRNLDQGELKKPKREVPGWVSTPKNKRVLLEDYRTALTNKRFLNRSALALEECLNFKYDNQGNVKHGLEDNTDDPTGARVNHADRAIADALDWKMIKTMDCYRGSGTAEEKKVILPGSLAWRRDFCKTMQRSDWSSNPALC
jgi:hypothetical protein